MARESGVRCCARPAGHARAAHSAATAQPSAFVEQHPIAPATLPGAEHDASAGEAQHPQPPNPPRIATGATEARA